MTATSKPPIQRWATYAIAMIVEWEQSHWINAECSFAARRVVGSLASFDLDEPLISVENRRLILRWEGGQHGQRTLRIEVDRFGKVSFERKRIEERWGDLPGDKPEVAHRQAQWLIGRKKGK